MEEDEAAVRLHYDGRVAVMTMQLKPYNLLGFPMIEALQATLETIDRDRAGAVLLRSALRHFSAGAELEMFEQAAETGTSAGVIDVVPFMRAWEAFPLPIVVAVHGSCIGGGFELALMCDYIVAAASSKIGSVEATLGLHPLMGGVQRQVQRAGALRAKEISMLARRYDAATLERWNLVNLVVADDRLEATSLAIAAEMANGPTLAHAATKALARIAADDGVAAADDAMAEVQRPIWSSNDLKAGLKAFRDSGPGAAAFEGR